MTIDGNGQIIHRSDFAGIERTVRHGETLLFAGKNEIHVTDHTLRRLRLIAWPDQAASVIDCFVDDAIYWVEGNHLRRCPMDGEPEDLCSLPLEMIAGTMDQWERTTGRSALAGWYIRTDMSSPVTFQMGDRPSCFYWRVAFDAVGQQFFLANALGPHLILSLGRSGRPRWCTYLCCGCCGGVPVALPNGLYVASSGCGGILSWLDREGKVLYQSVPHQGTGLATAYTSDVRVLPDGRCLADGGPGIVAYNARGDTEWIFQRNYSYFHCDPVRQIVVGCRWRTGEPTKSSVICLEFCRGL